ncbi:Molecular chaperone GroES [Planctomycetales bacterium 10988]|nr:Molecular chaperone GroES [Planctomycetales bacterium 10988]
MKETRRALETIEPIGLRVLIRKDEPKQVTKGGIHLPDESEIPTITGRVVAIGVQVENNPDFPLRQYDKVLIDPSHGIPVSFEPDNKMYIVPVDDIIAVFRRGEEDPPSED